MTCGEVETVEARRLVLDTEGVGGTPAAILKGFNQAAGETWRLPLSDEAPQGSFRVTRGGVDKQARLTSRIRACRRFRVDPLAEGRRCVPRLEGETADKQVREGMQERIAGRQGRPGLSPKAIPLKALVDSAIDLARSSRNRTKLLPHRQARLVNGYEDSLSTHLDCRQP